MTCVDTFHLELDDWGILPLDDRVLCVSADPGRRAGGVAALLCTLEGCSCCSNRDRSAVARARGLSSHTAPPPGGILGRSGGVDWGDAHSDRRNGVATAPPFTAHFTTLGADAGVQIGGCRNICTSGCGVTLPPGGDGRTGTRLLSQPGLVVAVSVATVPPSSMALSSSNCSIRISSSMPRCCASNSSIRPAAPPPLPGGGGGA